MAFSLTSASAVPVSLAAETLEGFRGSGEAPTPQSAQQALGSPITRARHHVVGGATKNGAREHWEGLAGEGQTTKAHWLLSSPHFLRDPSPTYEEKYGEKCPNTIKPRSARDRGLWAGGGLRLTSAVPGQVIVGDRLGPI